MKKLLMLASLILIIFSLPACEESSDDGKNGGNGSPGQGAPIADYYYSPDEEISATFHRYDARLIQYPITFDPNEDWLNYRTYPHAVLDEYFLVVADTMDQSDLLVPIPDSTVIIFESRTDSIEVNSNSHRHVELITWNPSGEVVPSLQMYSIEESDYVDTSITIASYDEWTREIYYQTLEYLIDDGMAIVDEHEWVEHNETINAPEDIVIPLEFVFYLNQMTGDSLIFRGRTDCNDNGEWDEAEQILDDCGLDRLCPGDPGYIEPDADGTEGNDEWDWSDSNLNKVCDPGECEEFVDVGNGYWDDAEPWLDDPEGTNGVWDGFEAFQDRNCNGRWDDAEPGDVGSFDDIGNGIWDDDERFTDTNNDGSIDFNELFIWELLPNNLVVSYDEGAYGDRRILSEIQYGDTMKYRWGGEFIALVDTVEYHDIVNFTRADVERIITTFYNRIVLEAGYEIIGSDFTISKVTYMDDDERQYDYEFYRLGEQEHIYELVFPSYFFPEGYFGEVPGQTEWHDDLIDGFWFEDQPIEQVYYYAPNGMIRPGEYIYKDSLVTTDLGQYYIEYEYEVARDTILVPVSSEQLDNVFKVTTETRMTLIGPGIEYGERRVVWLGNNADPEVKGVVRDRLYIRWTEAPWQSEEEWVEYSRLELAEYESTPIAREGLLGRLLNDSYKIKLDEFGNSAEFDYEPFKRQRSAGFHVVKLDQN